MDELQEEAHGAGHDYEPGSPHLRHRIIRNRVIEQIRDLIQEQFSLTGACRVLEIGAGHGGFTEIIAATGADVVVTEMSRPSVDLLCDRFAWNSRVRVLYDRDGRAVFADSGSYSVVLCISVLHHVPDYLTFISGLTEMIDDGGAFASFQDPTWYPRRVRTEHWFDRTSYYLWRLGQPALLEGARTRLRRARGVYDETNPSDMVEYHVVRSGVDDIAIQELIRPRFEVVSEWRYWSTQSSLLQAAGNTLRLANTFGVVGRGRVRSA